MEQVQERASKSGALLNFPWPLFKLFPTSEHLTAFIKHFFPRLEKQVKKKKIFYACLCFNSLFFLHNLAQSDRDELLMGGLGEDVNSGAKMGATQRQRVAVLSKHWSRISRTDAAFMG